MGTHTKSADDRTRDQTRAILDAVRAIVRALRVSTRAYEKSCGLNGAQIFILQQIRAQGRLSVNELAEKTFTHQSTVSESLGRLVRAKLVSKASSKKDARRVEVSLTPRGEMALRGTPRTAQEEMAKAIQGLASGKRSELAALLRELVARTRWVEKAPPLFFEESRKKRSSHG